MYALLLVHVVACFFFGHVQSRAACDNLFCHGDILHKVQTSRLFKDTKMFVDMPTKYSEVEIKKSFSQLPKNVSNDELRQWISDNFYPPAHEINQIAPKDWINNPKLLEKIKDEKLKELANAINLKWKNLSRLYNSSALNKESISTLFPLEKPFIIPGGRFLEFYYWDSFWILQGLLKSEMKETSKNLLENISQVVRLIGFVPNGSRKYYANRSQPPLLAAMMRLYAQETGDYNFVRNHMRVLDMEYEFWMRDRSVRLQVRSGTSNVHRLNIFSVDTDQPRPESYVEDLEQAEQMPKEKRAQFYANIASVAESGWDFSSRWMNFSRISQFVKSNEKIESDAELLQETQITHLLPVDLNAILYDFERTMQMFYCRWRWERAEYKTKCVWYGENARRRFWSMSAYLYDEESGLWSDFNVAQNTRNSNSKLYKCAKADSDGIVKIGLYRKNMENDVCTQATKPLYISDLSSLWMFTDHWNTPEVLASLTGSRRDEEIRIENEIARINLRIVRAILKDLENDFVPKSDLQRLLLSPGGIAISNVQSGQQWDYPNSWAPYQQWVVEGLLSMADKYESTGNQLNLEQRELLSTNQLKTSGLSEKEVDQLKKLALRITRNWLSSAYCGYKKRGSMFEKYDVRTPGKPGGGGEYVVQEGFGWTNGVILYLTSLYSSERMILQDCLD